MIPDILKTKRHWVHGYDLLRELVLRDMRVRYQGSVLGFAWAVLLPLLYVGVFYFVFQVVLELKIQRYTSFAFIGMLSYTWFSSSISQAAGVIRGSREMIGQPGFPTTVLPFVSVTTNLIHFLLAIPILTIVMILGGAQFSFIIFLVPIIILIQYILTLSICYFVAAANVMFRDTQHVVDIVLKLGFFLTPIFYDHTQVPSEYQAIYSINPLVPIFEAYRGILIGTTSPDWIAVFTVGVFSLICAYFTYQIFLKFNNRFADEL